MSDNEKALGTLLMAVADLSNAAETHGIVGNPPLDMLDPLIEAAAALGVHFDHVPSLAELHLALEAAAQRPGPQGA
jgi:hypothetical protein